MTTATANRYLPNVARPFDGDDTWNLPGIFLEVKNGCAHDEKRRTHAAELQDWFDGDSEKYLPFKPSEDALSWLTRPKRTSFITRQAVCKLTSHLYKPGPRARRITQDDQVDAWYRRVAQDLLLDALMKRCDQLATLMGQCAVGLYATGDPRRPVNYHLYPRTDYTYWCDPRDPRLPVAVCTITRVDKETTRFRIWTKHAYYTFYRGRAWGYQVGGWGSARYDPASSGPHDYGALPFVLVTDELPTVSLEIKGKGHLFAKVNKSLNVDMSNLALWVHLYARPLGFISGVGPDWRPKFLDGGFVPLVARITSTESGAVVPTATYLQSNLNIAALWAYIRGQANAALAEIDVPLTTTMQSDGGQGTMAASGLSVMAQDADLITYAKGRQPIFEVHETKLAALACRVGATPEAGQPEALRSKLLAAAEDMSLRLLWPEVYCDLPSRDRDDADSWELANDLTDPIEILMRRHGYTDAEATEAFERVQLRKARAARIVARAQALAIANADAEVPEATPEDAGPETPGTGQDVGDMGVPGGVAPSGALGPVSGVPINVTVTTVVDPQMDIPAAPLILPASPGFGGWGTES